MKKRTDLVTTVGGAYFELEETDWSGEDIVQQQSVSAALSSLPYVNRWYQTRFFCSVLSIISASLSINYYHLLFAEDKSPGSFGRDPNNTATL